MLKSLQAVLNLTIDESVFILLGSLLELLAPKNPNVFYLLQILLLEAISYDHFREYLCSDPTV